MYLPYAFATHTLAGAQHTPFVVRYMPATFGPQVISTLGSSYRLLVMSRNPSRMSTARMQKTSLAVQTTTSDPGVAELYSEKKK